MVEIPAIEEVVGAMSSLPIQEAGLGEAEASAVEVSAVAADLEGLAVEALVVVAPVEVGDQVLNLKMVLYSHFFQLIRI